MGLRCYRVWGLGMMLGCMRLSCTVMWYDIVGYGIEILGMGLRYCVWD